LPSTTVFVLPVEDKTSDPLVPVDIIRKFPLIRVSAPAKLILFVPCPVQFQIKWLKPVVGLLIVGAVAVAPVTLQVEPIPVLLQVAKGKLPPSLECSYSDPSENNNVACVPVKTPLVIATTLPSTRKSEFDKFIIAVAIKVTVELAEILTVFEEFRFSKFPNVILPEIICAFEPLNQTFLLL
jgi:hypothetical protein